MKLQISVSVYCPRSSVERKVLCHQLLFGGYCCKGCEDIDNSDICKKCIQEVSSKLTPEDFG
ncbi:MAG: hypothetical protein J6B94_08400 [Lachnospiraceae bacterium]|nr:hypothetical protein [Lachnospiraceae bacterium]